MGGIVNKITDDVLGFDPGGGGIYNVANDVLGDTIADDILGLDPNGGGIVPLVNTAANVAVAYALGDVAGGLLGQGSTLLGTAGGGAAAGSAAAADAAFIAADAAQLAAQGLGEAQIASTLASAGVSSGAANLAASMAANGINQSVINQQLTNLSSNTGLFSQSSDAAAMQDFYAADAKQLAAQTGNNIAAIEQNLIAAGLDPLDAATYATNAVLASGAAPSKGMWDEFGSFLKQNPNILNLLGAAGAAGMASPQESPSVPAYKPQDSMPMYSPEYYQQVQKYYTGYMPEMPRDVATPLQDWYSSEYPTEKTSFIPSEKIKRVGSSFSNAIDKLIGRF